MWIKDQKGRLLHLESGNLIYATATPEYTNERVVHEDVSGEYGVTIFEGSKADCTEVISTIAQKLNAQLITVG